MIINLSPKDCSAGVLPLTGERIKAPDIKVFPVLNRHPATVGEKSINHKTNTMPDDLLYYNGGERWGWWVTIDPRVDVYDVKITSTSDGQLYAISIWDSLDNDHILVHRSTDNGYNWQIYWEYSFRSDYKASSPGIGMIKDTIIMWYVIKRISDNSSRTWFRVCLPGASDSCIYYGSPTGGYNRCEYTDLRLVDDSPVYNSNEYLYAAWIESYGISPDSTRVMFARSDEIDVRSWELGPSCLYSTIGTGVYFSGSDIAFGSTSDVLWLTAWLHPSAYPTTYDRSVWGWFSINFGGSWSSENILTPIDNHKDEYDSRIAGSHINNNWVILLTQSDTGNTINRNVGYLYSNDNHIWTSNIWISSYEEYLSDIWVDNLSNAFYGIYRQDGPTSEYVLHVRANINDPSTWSYPIAVTGGMNLSGIYRPSVSRNMGIGEAVAAWTRCDNAYQICFTSESWYNISEKKSNTNDPIHVLAIEPNPNRGSFIITWNSDFLNRGSIKLYDESGRFVTFIPNGDDLLNRNSIEYSNRNLPAGIYFVRFELAGKNFTKKVIITK